MSAMEPDHMDRLYQSPNPFVRYVHTKRLEIIKDLVGFTTGRILDCGCAEGHLLNQLSGKKYGVDISSHGLKRARERNPDATILKGSLTHLPFDNDSFDVVTCSEVLEHISNYKTAIAEIKRVTKSNGGKMIISVPHERNWTLGRLAMLRFPIKLKNHVNSLTRPQLTDLFGSEPKRAIYIPLNLFAFSLTQIYEFEKRDRYI